MPRKKVHDEYFRIPAYQILAGKSDDEMSKILGVSSMLNPPFKAIISPEEKKINRRRNEEK